MTLGMAGCAAFMALLAWLRSGRRAAVAPAPSPVPAVIVPERPADPCAVRLQGRYDAGPLPETAEKFDLGPTCHDELRQKKQAEEQTNAAAVEFILNQNLALLAALNPGAADAAPVVDHGGFALPAEPPGADDDEFTIAIRDAVPAAG